MNIKEIFHETIMDFFILSTCITAAMAVLGMMFDSGTALSYKDLATPLIFSALCVIPKVIMFSRDELTEKQIVVRKIIQFVVIEAEVLLIAINSDNIDTGNAGILIGLSVSVFVIFIISEIVNMFNSYFVALKMTDELRTFKHKNR